MVTNLLSNAAKYTEKGGITLSFEQRDQDGQMMLAVTVKDTGIGIRKEDMDKLFTQFARFDLEKNRNIEGTGLGLSLAKRLTDLMHGTLELQSVYGVDTSAALTVPQQVVDSEPVNGGKLEAMILKYLPREKYRLEAAGEDAGGETGHPEVLKQLARLYPKVDLSKGLSVCADSYEAYLDVLQTYAEQPETDKLNECLEQEKAYDYRVCVHGIKSASLSIGFSELAAQALALENAARGEDWDFIRANHSAFLDEYRLDINAIRKALRL